MSTPTKLPRWRKLRKGEVVEAGDEMCWPHPGMDIQMPAGHDNGFVSATSWAGRIVNREQTDKFVFRRPISVRDAKPAKKATKKAKRVKLRAQIAYADTDLGEISTDWAVISEGHRAPKCDPIRVLVIPFDAASREALVRKAGDDLANWNGKNEPNGDWFEKAARAVLATLHPDFAKEGR
jgi:hypothetical protein